MTAHPGQTLSRAILGQLCAALWYSQSRPVVIQIKPRGDLPLLTKRKGGKVVIVNLQPTRQDKHAHLCINGYMDEVMNQLMELLGMDIPKGEGPTFCESFTPDQKPLPAIAAQKEVKRGVKKEGEREGRKRLAEPKKDGEDENEPWMRMSL